MSTPVPPPGLYTQPPAGLPPYLADRPAEAADPTVLTDGKVVQHQVVPAPAGGGAFSVDLDRAPEVLRDLENARQELIVLRKDALRLGQVDPSSNDQVSHDAAAALGAVAVGGPGSLVEALDGGIDRLGHLIDAITTEMGAYSATEQEPVRNSTARDWLVVVAFVAALSAACADPPVPAPPQPVTSASPRFGAPDVSRPLDVSRAFADPCGGMLTTAELRTLDISEQGHSRSYLGDSECFWNSSEGDTLSLAVDNNRDLLVDTYRSHLLPIFVPTEVRGYPSVRQKSNEKYNSCTVTTGLGPRQALQADWTGLAPASPSVDPCQRAEDAIALVIRKLPPQK